jgi:hypothetical protein
MSRQTERKITLKFRFKNFYEKKDVETIATSIKKCITYVNDFPTKRIEGETAAYTQKAM